MYNNNYYYYYTVVYSIIMYIMIYCSIHVDGYYIILHTPPLNIVIYYYRGMVIFHEDIGRVEYPF